MPEDLGCGFPPPPLLPPFLPPPPHSSSPSSYSSSFSLSSLPSSLISDLFCLCQQLLAIERETTETVLRTEGHPAMLHHL